MIHLLPRSPRNERMIRYPIKITNTLTLRISQLRASPWYAGTNISDDSILPNSSLLSFSPNFRICELRRSKLEPIYCFLWLWTRMPVRACLSSGIGFESVEYGERKRGIEIDMGLTWRKGNNGMWGWRKVTKVVRDAECSAGKRHDWPSVQLQLEWLLVSSSNVESPAYDISPTPCFSIHTALGTSIVFLFLPLPRRQG